MNRIIAGFFTLLFLQLPSIQVWAQDELFISGIYTGKNLYLQNPYIGGRSNFCILRVLVNDREVLSQPEVTAVEINFQNLGIALYTPVSIRVKQKEGCAVKVVNPEAIRFHSSFAFENVSILDDSLKWVTKGERKNAQYVVEKLDAEHWYALDTLASQGNFGKASYENRVQLKRGSNKFRIRYLDLDRNRVFLSYEFEHIYYPEPVEHKYVPSRHEIVLSRPSEYQMADNEGTVLFDGFGEKIDLSPLKPGAYYLFLGEEQTHRIVKNQ